MILGDRDLKYYLEKGWIVIDPLRDDTIREGPFVPTLSFQSFYVHS